MSRVREFRMVAAATIAASSGSERTGNPRTLARIDRLAMNRDELRDVLRFLAVVEPGAVNRALDILDQQRTANRSPGPGQLTIPGT